MNSHTPRSGLEYRGHRLSNIKQTMRACAPITTCEGGSLRRRLNSQEGTLSQGAWRASQIATGHGGGGCLGLDLVAHGRFDSVTVQRLPAWRADLVAPPLSTHQDLPNLIRIEQHKVERLCASVGGLGRVVLDPYRARQPVVLYDLADDPLGRLGDRGAEVIGQLRAEHNGSVLYFIGKVDPHAAL